MLGALIGTLAGLILCVYLPVLGKLVVTTILTALGLVAGVIVYRGPRRVPLERIMDERKLHNAGLLLEIQQLPKSAPQDVRDLL